MTHQQLQSTVACLESKVDMLETELVNLDQMLMRCGFSEGIKTLKFSMEELLKEEALHE